nr:IclR family transcriptional regulator C-terminal domain-containing protein [Burkholderia stagnalis]
MAEHGQQGAPAGLRIYTRQPGELRPLHANSIGKAIFAELPADAQQVLGGQLSLERFTNATITSLPALVEHAARSRTQGWADNVGESAPELSAVAIALPIDGDWYGLSVVGPTERIRLHHDAHVAALVDAKARLLAEHDRR